MKNSGTQELLKALKDLSLSDITELTARYEQYKNESQNNKKILNDFLQNFSILIPIYKKLSVVFIGELSNIADKINEEMNELNEAAKNTLCDASLLVKLEKLQQLSEDINRDDSINVYLSSDQNLKNIYNSYINKTDDLFIQDIKVGELVNYFFSLNMHLPKFVSEVTLLKANTELNNDSIKTKFPQSYETLNTQLSNHIHEINSINQKINTENNKDNKLDLISKKDSLDDDLHNFVKSYKNFRHEIKLPVIEEKLKLDTDVNAIRKRINASLSSKKMLQPWEIKALTAHADEDGSNLFLDELEAEINDAIIGFDYDLDEDVLENKILTSWQNFAKLANIELTCREYEKHLSKKLTDPDNFDEEATNSRSKELNSFDIGDKVDTAWKAHVNNQILWKLKDPIKTSAQRVKDIEEYISIDNNNGKKVKHIFEFNNDTAGAKAFKSIVNILTLGMPVIITGSWFWNSDGKMVENAIKHTLSASGLRK